MKITVCVGSSCHLKGSGEVVATLNRLAAEAGVLERLELCGAFCMGNCTAGVSVKLDDTLFSLRPETAAQFFENEIMKRLRAAEND